jgi:hypothetical protein
VLPDRTLIGLTRAIPWARVRVNFVVLFAFTGGSLHLESVTRPLHDADCDDSCFAKTTKVENVSCSILDRELFHQETDAVETLHEPSGLSCSGTTALLFLARVLLRGFG